MSRSLFGAWGAHLPQEDFATAIAAVGVLGLRAHHLLEPALIESGRAMRRAGRDIAVLKLEHLAALAKAASRRGDVPGAADYLAAWERFKYWWFFELPPNAPLLRLEIDLRLRPQLRASAPDPFWVIRQVVGASGASSAYLRVDEPDRPIAWEWPLRVGLLGDPRSLELAECVQALPWTRLVKLVRLDRLDEDCDLLLLPDDLRGAVARVLQQPRRLRADAVILTGGAGVPRDRIAALAAALRAEVLTGGIGIMHVDPDRQRQWITALVELLSHDMPLDAALIGAAPKAVAGEPEAAPLVIASRRLMMNARLTSFAGRFGGQLRRMAAARAAPQPSAGAIIASRPPAPPPVASDLDAAGAELETRARQGAWLAETGDASDVQRMRERAEASLGASLPAERDGAPALRTARTDDRRVRFTVTDVTDGNAPARVHDRLAPDRAYQMALDIGLPREGVESASDRFPSEKLPPSPGGHWLDVSFVPLVRAGSGRLHTPQQSRLLLPPQGDSRPCTLGFRTHGVRGHYRARILISHENRVIQTLLFSSPLNGAGRFALDVENRVAPNFDPTWRSKPFDAAIVVNHASDGRAGFTTLVGEDVSFREPRGLDALIGEVKRLLSAEATFPESRGALDDPALLKLFDDLARYGRSILKTLPETLQGRIPEGARIQIVEARSGAWLPIEILYGARLPKPDATLCPNARAALLGETGVTHESCAHRDDSNHHCPLRFWGFSSVIERQPALSPAPGVDYAISVPRPGADRLDAFRSALIGASSKVRAQDLTDPGGIVEAVKRVARAARTAKDWNEWESAVSADMPSLLMLLPHSQEDPEHPGITALEIGGVLLTYPELESSYVADPQAPSPVVLLLGCSTQLTDVPFLNFVEAFKRENAALVIGTLATIRGRRTVAFVSELLDGLHSAVGSEQTFGDVFLQTKRKLLAAGDGFVVSLTAYGDVGWRL